MPEHILNAECWCNPEVHSYASEKCLNRWTPEAATAAWQQLGRDIVNEFRNGRKST